MPRIIYKGGRRYIRDDTGLTYFDSLSEAEDMEKKIDKLYIIYNKEIIEESDGMKYQSNYYSQYLTANPDDSKEVQSLQNTVSRLLQDKKSDIHQVHLVERTWKSGHTSEAGIETEYWAKPEYKILKMFEPQEFLRLQMPK